MNGKAVVPIRRWSEQDLVAAAQKDDREAIAYLTLKHPPLQGTIHMLSRGFDPAGGAREELRAAGRLGVMEALPRFDASRGVRFRTYAYHFIRSEMIKALYSRAQQREWEAGREPARLVPFDPCSAGQEAEEHTAEAELYWRDDRFGVDAGYEQVERQPAERVIRGFVEALPGNQRRLVKDIFWDGKTQAEVARARGISRPAVTRTLQRTYARGRHELVEYKSYLAA